MIVYLRIVWPAEILGQCLCSWNLKSNRHLAIILWIVHQHAEPHNHKCQPRSMGTPHTLGAWASKMLMLESYDFSCLPEPSELKIFKEWLRQLSYHAVSDLALPPKRRLEKTPLYKSKSGHISREESTSSFDARLPGMWSSNTLYSPPPSTWRSFSSQLSESTVSVSGCGIVHVLAI